MQQHFSSPPSVQDLPTQKPVNQRRARRWLWFAWGTTLFTFFVGATWDGWWHTTRVFDTFFSPPHIFIYTMTGFVVLLVARIILSPTMRIWFGKPISALPFPFSVPGPLFLAAGGLLILVLAGTLDSLWHTWFGLDETLWSTPHALLAWGLYATALGFSSCAIALYRFARSRWYLTVLLAYLLIAAGTSPVLGPFHQNITPEVVRAKAAIPILALQPQAQHTFRIYLDWNLTQTNALFIPLAALWCGIALGLAHRLDPRARILLLIAFVCTLLGWRTNDINYLAKYLPSIAKHPTNTLPLPLFPAALTLVVLLKLKVRERWAWAMTGLVFNLLVWLFWPRSRLAFLLAFAAVPLTIWGATLGGRVVDVLREPNEMNARLLLFVLVSIPFLTGLIDLYLRTHKP